MVDCIITNTNVATSTSRPSIIYSRHYILYLSLVHSVSGLGVVALDSGSVINFLQCHKFFAVSYFAVIRL